MGDSRSGAVDFTAALNYISEAKDSSGRQLALPEFIIHAGDLDPVPKNYALYRSIFSKTACPRFLPVMGNHDLGYRRFICDSLLSAEGIRDRFDKSTVSYCVDIRNVRIIVVDQYKGTGFNTGCINDAGGAGNSADGKITVIAFFIDGQSVRADVVQSNSGTAQFSVTGRYFLSDKFINLDKFPWDQILRK